MKAEDDKNYADEDEDEELETDDCGCIPRRCTLLACLALCLAGISCFSLTALPAMGYISGGGLKLHGGAAREGSPGGDIGDGGGPRIVRSGSLAVFVQAPKPLATPAEPPADSLSDEPVDAVYTWVSDVASSEWSAALLRAVEDEAPDAVNGIPAKQLRGDAGPDAKLRARQNKYREWGELRYSMRSLLAHASWVRRIYVVTADASQVPPWLNTSHPRIRLVHHAELFDDPATQLPTFNSLAIESVLHRIPGLSNFFLYLNNDLLLNAPTPLSEFRTATAYFRYDDWAVQIPRRCSALVLTAHTRPPDAEAYSASHCVDIPLMKDAILARWAFGVRITHWQAHVPHLWERRVLREVEARLAPQFAVSRRNRLRDARSDVSMHRMYEAWLLSAAASNMRGEVAVVPRSITKSAQYFYVVFDNNLKPAADEAAFKKLLEKFRRDKPRFVGLEDDLHEPTPEQIAWHLEKMTLIMKLIAPQPAPWELD